MGSNSVAPHWGKCQALLLAIAGKQCEHLYGKPDLVKLLDESCNNFKKYQIKSRSTWDPFPGSESQHRRVNPTYEIVDVTTFWKASGDIIRFSPP